MKPIHIPILIAILFIICIAEYLVLKKTFNETKPDIEYINLLNQVDSLENVLSTQDAQINHRDTIILKRFKTY